MITKTHPLIAVTANLSALNLDHLAVRNIVGEHQFLSQDGVNYVLICHPRHWRVAANYLTSKGATVAPPLGGAGMQVGSQAAGIVPAAWGVAATDSTWAAAAKMASALGWPAIDPAEL